MFANQLMGTTTLSAWGGAAKSAEAKSRIPQQVESRVDTAIASFFVFYDVV